jgi:hypothetical protein
MSKESPTVKRVTAKNYRLHIPEEIGRRLSRCHASIREAIQGRLKSIALLETARPSHGPTRLEPTDPPLRFYASESYRVSYRIDRLRRTVVVLALRREADA